MSGALNKIAVGVFNKPAVVVEVGGVQVVVVVVAVGDQPVVLLVSEYIRTGLLLEEKPYSHVNSCVVLRCSFDGRPQCAPGHTAVFGVRSAQIERWLRYFRANQSVCRVPEHENRHEESFWEDDTLLRAVMALVRDHPLALQRKHSAMMTTMRAVHELSHLRVAKKTVDSMLRCLGFIRKVIIRLYCAANPERRREHAVIRELIGSGCLVSVDETQTDGNDVLRRHGRVLAEERVNLFDISPRHVDLVSTTMAVSSDGRILGFHSSTAEVALSSHDWRLDLGRVIQ